MVWTSVILLFLCGALAAKDFVIAKKPNAKELIDKIGPYQEWIGVVTCVVGLWAVIRYLLWLRWGLDYWPLMWVTVIAGGILQVVLGFLLGYAPINKHLLSMNEKAAKKGQEYREKLVKIQVKLGVAAMIVAVWAVIVYFAFAPKAIYPVVYYPPGGGM